MNIEIESEKSSETVDAPLWKYVTKLEKQVLVVGMLFLDVIIVKKLSRGLIQG